MEEHKTMEDFKNLIAVTSRLKFYFANDRKANTLEYASLHYFNNVFQLYRAKITITQELLLCKNISCILIQFKSIQYGDYMFFVLACH